MSSRFNLPVPFGWYAVALATELESAEVKPLTCFGKPLVLFRTSQGEAKVVDAMCPHLGANLGVGSHIEGETIVCAFHGWKFNGDGYCTEIPYAERMPTRADGRQCLNSYPTQELNGFIWSWYHPKGEQPLYELREEPEFNGAEGWIAPVVDEWIINAPIQETGENAVDTAHFCSVHAMQDLPEAEVEIDGYIRKTKLINKVRGINPDGSRTEEETGSIELTSLNNGPGQTIQKFGGSYDIVLMGTITPIDADTTLMRFVYAVKAVMTDEDAMMQDAFRSVLSGQVEQDIPIWNNKFYNDSPILCDGDGPINQYRKWFSQFYC